MEEQGTNSTAPFRKYHFKRLYPHVDLLTINRNLFELDYDQISERDRYLYRDYFSELSRVEFNNGQEEVERKLLTLYNAEIVKTLMRNLPANTFRGQVRDIDTNAFLGVLRKTFTHANESEIEFIRRKIYLKLFGIQSVEELNVVPACIPEFPPSENAKIINVTDNNTEFFPHKYIYVRNCFSKMIESIESFVKHSPIAVIGDSGIGITTFMRYVFLKMRNECKNRKIYWEMESGQWIFYDGLRKLTGCHDFVNWSEADVLVLVEGKLKPKFLMKQKKIIVFNPPQP